MVVNPTRYISWHRTELMALAIIGVLCSHSKIHFGWLPADRLMLFGQAGVDIFFFVSGFGLFYSSLRKPKLGAYYLRRLLRLLPAFLIVLLIRLWDMDQLTWENYMKQASMLGFWFPSLKWKDFAWFVAAILPLYLLFPLYFRFFRRHPEWAKAFGILVGLLLTAWYAYDCLYLHVGKTNTQILFFSRIPIFTVGCYFAYLSKCRLRFGRRFFVTATLLGCLALCSLYIGLDYAGWPRMRQNGLFFLAFLPIVPAFCMAAGYFMEHVPQKVLQPLKWIGACTLESYLLMGTLARHQGELARATGLSKDASIIVLFCLCILLAYLLHRILDVAIKRILRACS